MRGEGLSAEDRAMLALSNTLGHFSSFLELCVHMVTWARLLSGGVGCGGFI